MDWALTEAADLVREQDGITVVAHIDADGVAASAVAASALDREGIPHEVVFVKQMEAAVVEELPDGFIWFVDLGSGSLELLEGLRYLITDHHAPSGDWPPVDRSDRGDLTAYMRPDDIAMLNPHLLGLDGAVEISGAGVAYLVARELSPENIDLAHIGVIGAVGDLQDARENRLVGMNRTLIDDAVAAGRLEVRRDVRMYGRETRPLQRFLAFSDDPVIPGARNDEAAALELVRTAGIRPRDDGRWRCWVDLSEEERERLLSAVVKHMMLHGSSSDDVRRLIGEVYIIACEEEGTSMHDAREYSTLLNACGRYDRAMVGHRLLRGDPDARNEAMDLLKGHKRALVDAMNAMRGSIVQREGYQFFDAGNMVSETIVGTVAGMLLTTSETDPSKPIFGFAAATPASGEGDVLKVSARMDRDLKGRIDLNVVVGTASEAVGGFGGGHDVAAGGSIPADAIEAFLSEAGKVLAGPEEAPNDGLDR